MSDATQIVSDVSTTHDAKPRSARTKREIVALVGNPNAGKTSLFNQLTGLRARTANFAGTTVEHRRADTILGDRRVQIIDLPGLYSLDPVTEEERVARAALEGDLRGENAPGIVVLVVDSTNLERNLFLVSQTLELGRPTIVALNMMDESRKQGIRIDAVELSKRLDCTVVPVSARTGEGLDLLRDTIARTLDAEAVPRVESITHNCDSCGGCSYAARYHWAERIADASVTHPTVSHGQMTESIDRVLTHPVVGLLGVIAVMTVTFLFIFWIAAYPMDMIDGIFAWAGSTVSNWLPNGYFQSLVVDGIIPGVGGMLIFLPQIIILFFLLSLLEDSGYMARAAFVMEKLMHRVGLPGKAFVPMLSAHACAIPAIMSTRVIEDKRDRLATMLVIPLMSCSARVPVYAMIIALLFPHSPLKASMTFIGAYVLGVVAALGMGFVFKNTILKGKTRPMVIELPSYRTPSLKNAALHTFDRARVFVIRAGSLILLISIALWALGTFPKLDETDLPPHVATRIAQMETAGATESEIAHVIDRAALEYSMVGRIGRAIEPIFRPLGFNWEMSVGVLSSFAAREVVVSTLAVVYGIGEEGSENDSLYGALRASKWPDGTPVFGFATLLSMLVFYVLAMQCLPTNAVTKRETGSWKWPLLQIGYMSALAYGAAWIAYRIGGMIAG